MNIFALDHCPEESAKQLCDIHLSKMLVESCQLLATCFSLERLAQEDCPRTQSGNKRKHFNPKHPSALWVRESTANMDWLILHTLAMEDERLERGMNPHFCVGFLHWVILNIDDAIIPEGKLTEFKVAINEKQNCRTVEGFEAYSPTTKYKLYYLLDKPFAKWTKNKPNWMQWTPQKIAKTFELCV